MKHFFTLAIYFSLFTTATFAQNTFMKHYGGSGYQAGYAVKECFDGGYIACGYTGSAQNPYDLFIVRLDSIGDTIWTSKFTSSYQRVAFDVIQTHDSGFVTTGYIVSSNTKLHLFKFDKNGDSLWSRQIGNNDWGQAIQERPDHGFMIAGSRLFRTDSMGNLTWSTPYPPFQYMYIEKTLAGGYALLSSGLGNIYLTLVDSIGYLDTAYAYPGYLYNPTNNVLCTTPDGGFVLTGSDTIVNTQVVRIAADGSLLWTQNVAGDFGAGVVARSDGGYAVVSNDSDQIAVHLTALDSSGNIQWTRSYNYPMLEWGQSLDFTGDGGFVLCGTTNSFYPSGAGYDMLVIKTDSTGSAIGVSVAEINNDQAVNAHPNPTPNIAELSFDHQLQDASVQVLNSTGQLVLRDENINGDQYIFDGGNLPAGIYYLTVFENDIIVARTPIILYR